MNASTPSPIKVCLIDDHILLRDALARALDQAEDIRVVQRAANGKQFITELHLHEKPDIVLLDIEMPEMDGHATAEWMRIHEPGIRILVVTMFDTDRLVHLLKKDVRGILKKDSDPRELTTAIREIMKNGVYCSPSVTGRLFNQMRDWGKKSSTWRNIALSDTELTFLSLVATERTYKEIADQMNVHPRTVDNYRDTLFVKLDVKSRVGLAVYAIKIGLTYL